MCFNRLGYDLMNFVKTMEDESARGRLHNVVAEPQLVPDVRHRLAKMRRDEFDPMVVDIERADRIRWKMPLDRPRPQGGVLVIIA